MSPWQVLGIPYGSPRSVVKEAYARLLKEHRPDRDPVGFRRIRDAYEQLRDVPEQVEHEEWEEEEPWPAAFPSKSAEHRAEPAATPFDDERPDGDRTDDDEPDSDVADGDEADSDEPDQEIEDVAELLEMPPPQRRWRPAFHLRLSAAMHRASLRGDPQRQLRVLRLLLQSWRKSSDSQNQIGNLLCTALHQQPLVRTLLTPPDLERELDRGEWRVTSALLQAHLASEDLAATNDLVAAIEAWCARHPYGRCGHFLVEAAGFLAFVDTAAAERLLDAAFRCRQGHQSYGGEVDLRIAVGHEIRAATLAERQLFTRALLLAPERRTEADESRAANSMRQRHGCAPLLAQLFKASLPKRWEFVISPPIERNLLPHPIVRQRPVRPHEPLRTEPEARRLSRNAALGWLLAMLAIVVIGRLVLRTPNSRPPSSSGAPRATPGPIPERIRSLLWPEQGNPRVPPPPPDKPAGGR